MFYVGEKFRFYVNIYDRNNNLYSPSTVTITVKVGDTEKVSNATMTEESTGVFYYDITFDEEGDYDVIVKADTGEIIQIEKTTLHVTTP